MIWAFSVSRKGGDGSGAEKDDLDGIRDRDIIQHHRIHPGYDHQQIIPHRSDHADPGLFAMSRHRWTRSGMGGQVGHVHDVQ